MKLFLCLILLSLNFSSFAVVRTLTAAAEQVDVTLQSVKDKEDLYYIQVENLESERVGRPWVVKRKRDRKEERFSFPSLGLFVSLGGRNSVNPYAKPPIVGFLRSKRIKYKLSVDKRKENLAKAYAQAECLDMTSKKEAEKEHRTALLKIKKACKITPKFSVDWGSFERKGLACNAREALKGMADLCKDSDYREVIGDIKTIKISYGDSTQVKLNNGKLTYVVSDFPENTLIKVFTYLSDNL